MRRREFIAGVTGMVILPQAGKAQQSEHVPRLVGRQLCRRACGRVPSHVRHCVTADPRW
jgi:hypothetical protein